MKHTKLKTCDPNSLDFIKKLGNGTYGTVHLYYHKNQKKFVVGKLFLIGGNQKTIEKRFFEAQREAKILARIKHENIISHLGTITKKNGTFGIILEYAPCGDLESLLFQDTDVPLSWKIRARFFAELASAIDYLHYHDQKRPFIHRDLKPQNVLLGDMLTIKLADFGATTIAKLTGATTLTITGGNTQHTPYYTAPEYLVSSEKKRQRSMDVYSYGMIGYEIITRKPVYSGSAVSVATLLTLIAEKGQKPSKDYISKEAKTLTKNSSDWGIFHELKKVIYQCWQTAADDRPRISEVKQQIDKLAQDEKVYKKAINAKAKSLIIRRKLKTQLPEKKKSSKAKLIAFSILAMILAFGIGMYRSQKSCSCSFLALNHSSLIKYDLCTASIETLLQLPTAYQKLNILSFNFVYVHDTVYVIPGNRSVIKANLVDSVVTWKKDGKWKSIFRRRKYIGFHDKIFAIGAVYDPGWPTEGAGSTSAYSYCTQSQVWTTLPSMHEPRLSPGLVIFQGSICAVGGGKSMFSTVECFNPSENV